MTEKLQRSAIAPKNPLLNASRAGNLPHVPGIRVGDYIFLSGMVPVDPQTGERSHGPIAEQVRVTLSNMRHMLESAGSSLERVVRVHVVLADISHMAEMDRVYREFFPVDPPARTAWSMQLRFGNGCEIECVALAGLAFERHAVTAVPIALEQDFDPTLRGLARNNRRSASESVRVTAWIGFARTTGAPGTERRASDRLVGPPILSSRRRRRPPAYDGPDTCPQSRSACRPARCRRRPPR